MTTALHLQRAGFDVHIYELAKELRALGVGINLLPYAVRVLTILGLQEALNKIAVEARYVLKTDDEALITIVNTGLRRGPPEVMLRLARGEEVDPSLYYFWSVLVFETSAAKYDWLNRHVFVANIRNATEVII